MSKIRARSGKPAACANCGGNNQRRRITTYPVRLTEPARLAGKEIFVGSVAVYECQSCGHLCPRRADKPRLIVLSPNGSVLANAPAATNCS